MNRRITGLVAAGALALTGTLILVGYVRSAEARALSGEELVEVLVVTDTIPAGTPADEIGDSVSAEQIPSKVRAEGAVAALEDLEGLVTAVDLLPGEQLVAQRFAETVARPGVPSGLLEVTVSLDPERAVGGRLSGGDTVAVFASFEGDDATADASQLILHKVLVTSVQLDPNATKPDSEDDAAVAPAGKLLVTLAIDAPAVEKVVFAAEHGRLWLSIEPGDAPAASTGPITQAQVLS